MAYRRFGRLLSVSSAALAVWLVVAAGSLTWLDPDTAMLGWMLLALTTTLAVTDLIRYAGWVVAIVGSVLYAGLQITLAEQTDRALVNTGVAAVGLIGAALLSYIAARHISAGARQLENDRRLIDELTIHDPKTRLVKWQYARHTLKSEIARSRRYHTDLSLIVMRVANWDELLEVHNPDRAEELMIQVSRIVADTLRTMDSPTLLDSMTLGAILPETPAEGSQVVAQRLVDGVAHKTRVALNVGIAHFPRDAVTEGELVRAAEAALQFALRAGRTIVSYDQLSRPAQVERGEDLVERARATPRRESTTIRQRG